MIEVTVDVACIINKRVLKSGECFNVLDAARLESALGNQFAPYPFDEQAIASVYRSLVQNHPFENGNKRTAVVVLFLMSESINTKIALSEEELCELTYSLAMEGGGKISTTSIANKLFGMTLEERLVDEGNHMDARPTEVECLCSALSESRKKTAVKSNGVYSVMRGEWIKEPVAQDIPEVDREAFDAELTKWEDRYFDILKKPTKDNIDDFLERIYDLRKTSIAEDGEYSIGNLVFKQMRDFGYINELRDKKRKLTDKELSLENLNESADMHKYVYNGPALLNGRRGWFVHLEAEAQSIEEGIEKLIEKVRRMFPKANPDELDIIHDSVYEDTNQNTSEKR